MPFHKKALDKTARSAYSVCEVMIMKLPYGNANFERRNSTSTPKPS
jgi:hypothetical protein